MSDRLQTADLGSILAEAVYPAFDRDSLARYARASGDLNPLHLDPVFARQAGFEDVIVHGMLGMALLGRLLEESFSGHPIEQFRVRFRSVIPLGFDIHCTARLQERDDRSAKLLLTGDIRRGETLVIDGTATLGLDPAGS